MTNAAPDAPAAQDFLAHCVAGTTGNPLLEQIRDRSSEGALAIFRLCKNVLVHAVDNEAVVKTIQQTHEILGKFSQEIGSGVAMTFAGDTVESREVPLVSFVHHLWVSGDSRADLLDVTEDGEVVERVWHVGLRLSRGCLTAELSGSDSWGVHCAGRRPAESNALYSCSSPL